MARTNKYASVNFNEIYEKKFSNTTNNNPLAKPTHPINSSLPNNGRTKTIISNSRIHGNMLVLTRPTPKPISIPPQEPPPLDSKEKPQPSSNPKDQGASQVESISLRPQGRTGTGPSLGQANVAPVSALLSGSGSSLKTNKFVPPHLRPGFVGREEKPAGPGGRGGVNRENRQGICGENGRPKSGGGYEMMRGGVDINYGRGGGAAGSVAGGVDPGYFMNQYGSRGTRPNSSG